MLGRGMLAARSHPLLHANGQARARSHPLLHAKPAGAFPSQSSRSGAPPPHRIHRNPVAAPPRCVMDEQTNRGHLMESHLPFEGFLEVRYLARMSGVLRTRLASYTCVVHLLARICICTELHDPPAGALPPRWNQGAADRRRDLPGWLCRCGRVREHAERDRR